MKRRIPVRVFGAESTRTGGPLLVVSRGGDFKGEGADSPYQGEMSSGARQKGEGQFEIPLSLSGSLVTFCPH